MKIGFRCGKASVRAAVCSAFVVLLLMTAIFAPYLAPFDPYEQTLKDALLSPGPVHLLGTDRYGRDLLSRVIMGTRPTIFSTLGLVVSSSLFGTAAGLISGLRGGWVDELVMRISDLFLAFPGMVFAIAVAGAMGGGIHNAVIALAAVSWPKYARLARGEVLSVKSAAYMFAARLSGCSPCKLIFKYILPNIIPPVIVTAILDIGAMMMEISGLSFLGLGAQPPAAEWGSMMSQGRSMIQTAPWVILAPGLAIFFTVMIFQFWGDSIRDQLDPRK